MSEMAEEHKVFAEACAGAGLLHDPEKIPYQERVAGALAGPYYGFVMRDNLSAATKLVQAGESRLPIHSLPHAMGSLALLLGESEADYTDSGFPVPDKETWEAHIGNVRQGQVVLLPEAFWTTEAFGRQQVERANAVFGSGQHGDDEQILVDEERLLAALNYQLYFKPDTMAGAARVLSESPEIAASSEEVGGMPHLSVSNWTIGEVAQHVYEQMSQQPRGTLHIVDVGSESGATLSAIVNRLGVAQSGGMALGAGRLSLAGLETTPVFFDQLRDDFLPAAEAQLKSLDIPDSRFVPLREFYRDPSLEGGTLSVVEGDAVQAIEAMDMSQLGPEDVVMLTANYSFHRLPARRKLRALLKLAEAPNSILAIGDLRRNGSVVNRGYFNLSNNGPLNAGNLGLESYMAKSGYSVHTVGVNNPGPAYIHQPLRERLANELENDAFVAVAHQGKKAAQLLEPWPTEAA